MSASLLIDGLKELGLSKEQSEVAALKIEKYINEIILFNSAYNLTNTSEHDELVIRHIFDSLSPFKYLSNLLSGLNLHDKPLIADIGSGGGLPGIPLSIVFDSCNFNLVERMNKRCAFLENCAAILGLKNITVVNSEAEKLPDSLYDVVVFRVFRPLEEDIIKTLLRITKKGGYLLAYKAKHENIKSEMQAIKHIVSDYKVEKLNVPNLKDTERNLVIIQKQ